MYADDCECADLEREDTDDALSFVCVCGHVEEEHRRGATAYMDDGEQILCDYCMWTDPRYIRDYGDMLPRASA